MTDRIEFKVLGLGENVPVGIEKSLRGEVEIYTINVGSDGGEPIDLSEMRITLTADASEAVGRWFPVSYQYNRGVRETWCSITHSSFAGNAPIYSYYRSDDANLLTAAIDDTITSWELCSGVDEEMKILRFTARPTGLKADHRVFRVFVDRSNRPYYKSIRDAALWWAELKGGLPEIPECAYDPVYSSWYTFHRDIDAESVLKECEAAAELGCKTVFIDDGWATPKETSSFTHAGDWKPNREKFPDFKGFVDKIHSLGMRAVLWVAPGLSGFSTCSAKLYKNKYISKNDGWNAYILDPRYPFVRSALYRDVCDIIADYGFDGLKIDFVDSIQGADCEPDDERDYLSVSEALNDLLTNIYKRLRELNPDVLIEYRQSYTGPDILTTANIIRSADCAQDFLTNRVNTIDLRLHTNLAVHSDMIQIIENEAPESSALQLTNVLFSTPQISARLDSLSDGQKKMLKFWIGFMSDKRVLLQKSSFEPSRCYSNYPSVTVRNADERLTALYGENLLMLDEISPRAYVVNAYTRGNVYVGSSQPYEAEYRLLDCMGNETGRGEITLNGSPKPFSIPFNGIMIIEK